jgi:tetratricopeptide (TPR) repeat protein
LSLLVLSLTLRSALAFKYGHADDKASLERAARFEPDNAARHHWLGRVALFVEQDHQAAVRELSGATRLNPWIAEYWLDLALAYKAAGDSTSEAGALDRALHTEPKNLNAAISEGNFYLSRGETATAMQRFREVLENDAPEPLSVIDTCWRATRDSNAVLAALPPRADLHFRFLELLVRYGDVDASAKVWQRLVSLPQPFQSGKPLAYVDWLIGMKQPAAARAAWDQVQQITTNGHASSEPLVNPGFEDDLQNAGFDWRFANGGAVTFDQDEEQAHSGKHSLAISYSGAAINDSGVWQLFTVEPGETIHLAAFTKTKDLLASERPRLGVEDFYTHALVATGQPIADASLWQPTRVDFTVPPDCHLVAFRIVLGADRTRIKGTLWIDDFQVTKTVASPVMESTAVTKVP